LKLYLVRHAEARKRAGWAGPDSLRPLSARGEGQAHGLVDAMEGAPLVQIFTCESLRCRETVAGLGAMRGISVELEPRLHEKASAQQVLSLLGESPELPTLVCAGRRLILDLLSALGVQTSDDSPPRCQKGSIWVLRGRGLLADDAEYISPIETSPSVRAQRRLAVLDLGSTSFSLAVVDVTADGEFESILRQRLTLQLGAHTHAGGPIPEEDCERAVEAVGRLRAEAESVDAESLYPVGTAILRDASNAAELAARMGEVLGQPVQLLSGEAEAGLAYRAIQHRLGVGEECLLAADLGGGSLELATGVGADCDWTASLPIGVTRLRAELVRSSRLSKAERRAVRDRVRELVEPCVEVLEPRGSMRLIVAGGTVRALARLALTWRKKADRTGLKAMILERSELEEIFERLERASDESRLSMPAVQPRRADLLPVGALILSTLLDVLNRDELVVSDWGLREGVILEALEADLEECPVRSGR
jgi:exopolyphosphatase/guanosine-5'-triphosphate,3'-diphosphate pyrophosphatase